MRRLKAIEDDAGEPDFDASFVAPTRVDDWSNYLGGIQPTADRLRTIADRPRRNLAYRLQLLEFEVALLLLNHEAGAAFPGRSTLHETITRMKTHQVAVLVSTLLEGIGSHFVRVGRAVAGLPENPNRNVAANEWRPALVDEVFLRNPQFPVARPDLDRAIGGILDWRHRVHMDRVEPHEPLHFNEFTHDDCFVPTYRTFRLIMTEFNPNWPPSCLNENL